MIIIACNKTLCTTEEEARTGDRMEFKADPDRDLGKDHVNLGVATYQLQDARGMVIDMILVANRVSPPREIPDGMI